MRALLATHGRLGTALVESARQVYASDAPITVISNEDYDAAGLRRAIESWLDEEPGEAIVMVDIGGGSCGLAARAAARGRADVRLLGGVNLAMVLTYLSGAGHTGLDELAPKMLDRALNAVRGLDSSD